MIISNLLQSIHYSKKLWLTSIAIATLATFVSNNTAVGNTLKIADSGRQLSVPPTANGVYLYGESDRPNVIGKEYLIFETSGTKTIGAFYLPKSEFSCFYGQFRGSRMYVTLIDTYDRQKYNLTLALNPNGLTASKQPMMGEPTYQPLDKISNNDRQILDTCKRELPAR
jgi:hypothetical protein